MEECPESCDFGVKCKELCGNRRCTCCYTATTTATPATTVPPQPPTCEAGWSEFQSTCYKLFEINLNYADATASCDGEGAQLASINSEEENIFVNANLTRPVFIGLDDIAEEGSFVWQDGSEFLNYIWMFFLVHDDMARDCVQSIDLIWLTVDCSDEAFYICEKPLQ